MVTKSNKANAKKGRTKISKLQLSKETIIELGANEAKQVRGGVGKSPTSSEDCPERLSVSPGSCMSDRPGSCPERLSVSPGSCPERLSVTPGSCTKKEFE